MANEVEMLQKARDPAGTPFSLTYGHAAVHNDIISRATRIIAAGTTAVNILFKSPGPLQAHIEWSIVGAADCDVRVYEGPTVTTEGTDMVQARLHRQSLKTTQTIPKTGGDVSAVGTLIDEQWNGGGGSGAGIRGGSVIHDDAEWIPKVNDWILIQVTRNVSTKLGITLEWYEVKEAGT